MIEWLKSYTITLCTAVFFITAAELILPNNNMKKYARFVMGMILITVIINPIIKLYDNGFNFDKYVNAATNYMDQKKYEDNYSKYKESNRDETMKAFQQNVQKVCIGKLQNKFSKYNFDVTVDTVYDEEKSTPVIQKVTVMVSTGKIEKVKKIIIGKENNISETKNEMNDSLGKEIKKYLSEEINVPESNIGVFKK